MTMPLTFRVFLAGLLLVAALVVPPAVAANVLAGVSGLALLGSIAPVPGIMALAPLPAAAAPLAVASHAAPAVFELQGGAGVVVFQEVDGRMTSRFYRANFC